MSGPSLIYDPNAGGDVEARLDFASEGLTVFDPRGRKLQHWPYAEIIHAFAADARRDRVLAHASRPEIHLHVRDDTVYAAIRERAPQLRRLRRGWRTFWTTLEGMPDEGRFGLIVLAGIAAFGIYGFFTGLFK